MRRAWFVLTLLAALTTLPASAEESRPQVALHTDQGTIVLALYPEQAPATVANFLQYVDDHHYAGTLIHRVVPGRIIQGGGYDFFFNKKATREPVANESANGLSNVRGTVAMARLSDPDSATSQFFINLRDNSDLDGSAEQPGYTVFADVVAGMAVVDAIAAVPTSSRGVHRNVPREAIQITRAERLAP